MNEHLIIRVTKEEDNTCGVVTLEQDDWQAGSDGTQKTDVINALRDSLFFSNLLNPTCAIGLDGETDLKVTVFAYPEPFDLQFFTDVTYGTIRSSVTETTIIEDQVNFTLDDESALRHLPYGDVKYTWLSRPYDSHGIKINPPVITFDGKNIKLSKKVYGSVAFTYRVYRKKYVLAISPRDTDVENFYQAVFYANWGCGVTLLEVDLPSNLDFDYENGFTCTGRSTTTISGPGDDGPPTAYPVDETIKKDYCSQLVVE